MYRKRLVLCLVAAFIYSAAAGTPAAAAGSAWDDRDIGTVAVAGSSNIAKNGRFKVSGEGADIGSTADAFHFLSQELPADGEIVARFMNLDKSSPRPQAGVMLRQSLQPGSTHVSLLVSRAGELIFKQRAATGGATATSSTMTSTPVWLRIVRSGSAVTAYRSSDGVAWTAVGTAQAAFSGPVYVGLAVNSRAASKLATAAFDRVMVSTDVTAEPPAPEPPAGPVSAWAFDEGAGSTARDRFGINDGSVSGATWTSSGKYGGALLFNGTSSLVNIRDNDSLDLSSGMTLEAWVRPMAIGGWQSVLMKENAAGLAYGLYGSSDTGTPAGYLNTGAGDVRASCSSQLPGDTWSFLAVTYDGTTQRIFINGNQVASTDVSGDIVSTAGALRIGGNAVWGEFFQGAIDNVRLYDRALTAEEIRADMNTPVESSPDTNAPSVSISSPSAGSTVTGTVTVTATASDDVGIASVKILVDGNEVGTATAAPYTASWDTTSVGNGTHAITATATDGAGNKTTSSAVSVTVKNDTPDTTAPTVTITSPANGAVLAKTVTIAATATDDVGVTSVQVLVNGQAIGTDASSPYAVSWDTTSRPNGTYSITAIATDAAGNSKTSAAVSVTVKNADTTAPTVVVTSPVAGAVLSGTVALIANATDDVGIASVRLLVNGNAVGAAGTSSPFNVSWDTTAVANGTYAITAVASDAAGNSTTSAAVNVTVRNVDSSAPTVAVTSPVGGAVVFGTVSLVASAADDVGIASVRILVNGSPVGVPGTSSPYSVAWNTSGLPNGTYTITATATDAGGNTSTSAPVAVTLDNPDLTAPSVSVTSPSAGAALSGTVTLAAGATDNVGVASVRFLVNGAQVGAIDTTSPYSAAWNTTAVSNGTYTIAAVATDAAGNSTTSAAISVTVGNADTTAPTVAITAPGGGAVLTGPTTISASASDNVGVASVRFLVNGAQVGATDTTSPYAVSWNTTAVANGSYTITAVATDAAGNTKTSAPIGVTVNNADTTAPSVAITTPAAGAVLSGTTGVSVAASDNVGVVSVRILVNGGQLGPVLTGSPYTVLWDTTGVSNGSYSISAVATDAAGNSKTSALVSITINNVVTTPAPRLVEFNSPDQNTVMYDGRALITSYRLEVWRAGDNIATAQPFATKDMGKPSTTSTQISIDQQAFFATLPSGQQYFTTVQAMGPAGNSRSTASNLFLVP
jgi:phage replication-related protein YjqB (UPF0714/DUF867 family)